MEPVVRPCRLDDLQAVVAFTRDTFPWGDYVADALPDWIGDPRGLVLVAEVDGVVAAMGRVVMVSDDEAWAQGARVDPEHRRRGLGTTVSRGLWTWARTQGANVVRLVAEDWNHAARAQVTSMGFKPAGSWIRAQRGVGENSPVPQGNGGRRVIAPEGLRPAHSAEAEPAMLSWSPGPLARAARGLFPIGWVWQRLTVAHLEQAARDQSLWEGRPGWAMADRDQNRFGVRWIETTEADALAMVRALVDRAAEAGAEQLSVMAPAVEWLSRALRHFECEIEATTVYTLPLEGM